MTIYINGKFLCQQHTGTQIYALSMLKAMSLQKIDFCILAPKNTLFSGPYAVKRFGRFSNLNLWEQVTLPLFLLTKRKALLINFCNSAPLLCARQIVTIHDLAFEQQEQQWFTKGFVKWYRFLIPKICRKAKAVFTVSSFSKSELIKYYKLPEKKIFLVPNVAEPAPNKAERLEKQDYLLMIGAENPRKNADFVLKNMDVLRERGLKLILLCGSSDNFRSANFKSDPDLITLDYVKDDKYHLLINNAKALLYLSSYEGFGIPVLNSLVAQIPVICSELPVFKESFGDLPIYMKTFDTAAFIQVLDQLKTKTISQKDSEMLRAKYSSEFSGQQIVKSLNSI